MLHIKLVTPAMTLRKNGLCINLVLSSIINVGT